jgi:hypothetical protein
VHRQSGWARIDLAWAGAFPDSVRRFRLERTAAWHHRLPFEWEPLGFVTGTAAADSIPLDPNGWPWRLGTGMGRIVTYRLTPAPPRPLDWTTPRLASALVLDPRFHDLPAVEAELHAAEAHHPQVVAIERLGTSAWGDRPILAARLTGTGPSELKPAVLVVGDVHTREPFGIEIGVDLVTDLAARYGRDPEVSRLLDAAVLWVVPAMNAGGWGHLSSGFPGYMRKNLADLNGDGAPTPSPLYPLEWDREPLLSAVLPRIELEGVDLNRNFAPQWELTTGDDSGSPIPGAHKYRGKEPFSEPESRAIRDLALRERFSFSFFYHEPGDRLYFLRGTPDEDVFTAVADSLERPARKTPGDWSGCTLAFMYYDAGTIDFTIEGATHARGDAEWLLAPRAAARDSVSAHHRGLILELLRLAVDEGVHGRVVDSSGKPIASARLAVRRPGEGEARVFRTNAAGAFHRYLLPGTYTLEVQDAGSPVTREFTIEEGRPATLEIVLPVAGA